MPKVKKEKKISENTLKMIDSSMKNLAKGKAGPPVNLNELKGKYFIACYKNTDRWMLITREISTLRHAERKAEPYKKAGYVVKIIPLDL